MDKSTIVVAGATGNLGLKIVRALVARNANVKALVRSGTSSEKLRNLQQISGVEIVSVDFKNASALQQACLAAGCVVSALSGLRDVIVDTQVDLLNAAVKAGVPRFIPSDYSLDYTKTPPGRNRNLDMRREFNVYLDKAPIAATSIFNSAFTELLTGEAPFILFKIKRILYWQSADQAMDFTTMDNTAAFTAEAALDSSAPRYLHIAGDRITPRKMAEVVSSISGTRFGLLRAGSLRMLELVIKITRTIAPAKQELYPAWQGMQYMRDMFSGLAQVDNLDNMRYAGIKWQTVHDFLTTAIGTPANVGFMLE